MLGSCTLIDVRMAPHGGVHSHAFISGYADAGWPASDSLLQVGLFDGPSQGALLYLQIWKLFRFELGFIGAALGLGPLDCGFGVLLYDPHPPLLHQGQHGRARRRRKRRATLRRARRRRAGEHGSDEAKPPDAATVRATRATPKPRFTPHGRILF